jgi:hypothetical protein
MVLVFVIVIGELLIIGGRAAVGALGGHREAGLRQPVVAVIFISGEVVLGVLERGEAAVAGIGQGPLGGGVGGADRDLKLRHLAGGVVDGPGDAVGAEIALRAQCAGRGGQRSIDGDVHARGRALRAADGVVAGLGEGMIAAAGGQLAGDGPVVGVEADVDRLGGAERRPVGVRLAVDRAALLLADLPVRAMGGAGRAVLERAAAVRVRTDGPNQLGITVALYSNHEFRRHFT